MRLRCWKQALKLTASSLFRWELENWVRNPICLISSCPTISNDHNVFISIVYSTAKCANITSEANITYHSGNGMLPYFSYSHDLNPNHYWTPFNIIWLYIYSYIIYYVYIPISSLGVFDRITKPMCFCSPAASNTSCKGTQDDEPSNIVMRSPCHWMIIG